MQSFTRHKFLQTQAREDDKREQSPNVDMEIAAQQQNISRYRRFEGDIVATTQGAARDTYVELWAKLPEELGIPEAVYVKLLQSLRNIIKEASVAPDVVDALLDYDAKLRELEDKSASLTQILAEHCEGREKNCAYTIPHYGTSVNVSASLEPQFFRLFFFLFWYPITPFLCSTRIPSAPRLYNSTSCCP